MKIRTTIYLLLITILVAACAPAANVTSPTLSPSSTNTQIPTETVEPPSAVPGNTQVPLTPTGTSQNEISILTNESPDVVLTAINLQLENEQLQLTQSAEEVASLNATISALETAVAVANENSNSSSNSGGSSSEYEIPSNVYNITMVQKATVWVVSDYNAKGAPVMAPFQPRVYLDAGSPAWVYKTEVQADGGTIFYESYDPDGESDQKYYFIAKDIQIRLPSGKPDPDNYPDNVAKATLIDNTVLFVAASYDNQGKPVITSYQPIQKFKAGDTVIIYPAAVIATGGEPYYFVYDPDGSPSTYIRAKFVVFPLFWD